MEHLKITKKKDYAIVQLNRGKVNAINKNLVEEIRSTIKDIAADNSIRGVIISGQPHFFSVGLDIIELYNYDRKTVRSFFQDFGDMYHELVQFRKPLIAAITGHSPAGGTVIAICCDYRIMAEDEKYSIGLNEVAVNIQISEDIIQGFSFWIGIGKATKYLLEGKLLKPKEAYQVGLLDEICPLEEVVERAEQQMQQYLKADDGIFQSTKQKCRKNWLENLSAGKEIAASNEFTDTWWRPAIRARMKGFVDRLTKK